MHTINKNGDIKYTGRMKGDGGCEKRINYSSGSQLVKSKIDHENRIL